MDNFDPDRSSRTFKKHSPVGPASPDNNNQPKQKDGRLFDNQGRYRASGADECDCLLENCSGCHFPCNNCRSTKCGPKCRVNRQWAYMSIDIDGKDYRVTNPHMMPKKEHKEK